MLISDLTLARRIELAEARLCTDVAANRLLAGNDAVVCRVDSGFAVYCGPGSPLNKLLAVGLDGPLDEDALAVAEHQFAERHAPVQAEISALAEPSAMAALARRGYVLVGVEHVLARRLDDLESTQNTYVPTHAIAPDEQREWFETVIAGFAHPDGSASPIENQDFPHDVLEAAISDVGTATGIVRYLATLDGASAGGATLRVCEKVAQLCGAATRPEFRRRGVQAALLDARLEYAREAGCDLAVITTQPGSRSQANAIRRGFTICYGRLLMIRQP